MPQPWHMYTIWWRELEVLILRALLVMHSLPRPVKGFNWVEAVLPCVDIDRKVCLIMHYAQSCCKIKRGITEKLERHEHAVDVRETIGPAGPFGETGVVVAHETSLRLVCFRSICYSLKEAGHF